MSCCDKTNVIPPVFCEIEITEKGGIKSSRVSEQDLWTLRAVLKAAGSESNPLNCNDNALASIKTLISKFGENKAEGCTPGSSCGCATKTT